MDKSSAPMPDAPPSYNDSVAQGPAGAAGGFAMPPPSHEMKGGPVPGSVPVGAAPQPYMAAPGAGMPPPGAATYVQAGGPMPAGPPGTQQVVVVVNPPNYGPNPVNMVCPHCQSQIQTSIESEPGPLAWIFAGILCVVGLWLCACVPCCIESLNSVTHKCPNCKNFLGRYKGGM